MAEKSKKTARKAPTAAKAKTTKTKEKKAPAKKKVPAKKKAVAVKVPAKKKAPTKKKAPAKKKSTARTIFFTGFPGFLGTWVAKEILAQAPKTKFYFLVQDKFLEAAKRKAADILGAKSDVEFFVGDLTHDDLGLTKKMVATLKKEVTEVWHLAAAYDIKVSAKTAWDVTVQGTTRVLDLCKGIKGLQKLVYFSSFCVSGLRTGLVLEDELEYGQGFKNNYESSKFEAEVLVRRRAGNVPTIVMRPGIVMGDSRSGVTDKFDGAYFMIRFLAAAQRDGYLKPLQNFRLPSIGKGATYFHVVPVDYIARAAVHIAAQDAAIGKTFALCDPDPLTGREFIDELYAHFGIGRTFGALPLTVARMLSVMPGLADFMRIPEETLDYANHYVVYDCRNTTAFLKNSDITCPRVPNYLGTLIDFVKEHLDNEEKTAKY
ncbi:MAG: SDR family oxidoreductase [Candidatus Lernaella stagnicola]|nr:SDR family oxidoreductase [Candidatus Lernaella stagnicola]